MAGMLPREEAGIERYGELLPRLLARKCLLWLQHLQWSFMARTRLLWLQHLQLSSVRDPLPVVPCRHSRSQQWRRGVEEVSC